MIEIQAQWIGVPEHLRIAVERYGAACVNESWKGGGDPESFAEVEAELEAARADLIRRLRQVTADAE